MSKMVDYSTAYAAKPIIGIAGIIASGKTTLSHNLADVLGWDMVPEPVKSNPYLPLFYQDMQRYGFTMQIFLLNKRFAQHQAMVWNKRPAVQDRTIYEDPIFALMLRNSGHITKLDFDTYAESYENMTNFLHRPDLIIYLDVTAEKAYARLVARGRECEKGVPLDYLKALKAGYEDWLATRTRGIPVLRLDWNDPASTEDVIKLIETKLGHVLPRFVGKQTVEVQD